MESPGKKFTDLVEIESIQDTDLTVVRNDTGVKKTPMQKLSDYIKQKFIGWVFSDLPTTDKTIPGAIKELNSALASLSPFECIDNVITDSNGSTSLTMANKMENDHLYLVFVRRISGNDAYPPYAYLLIMRSNNWRYTLIGEESGLANKSISGGKLTLTFEGIQWTRMTTYRIM